jgi:hypothetical protein
VVLSPAVLSLVVLSLFVLSLAVLSLIVLSLVVLSLVVQFSSCPFLYGILHLFSICPLHNLSASVLGLVSLSFARYTILSFVLVVLVCSPS